MAEILPLVDRNIDVSVGHHAVGRTDDPLAVEIQLLVAVSAPSDDPGHGEKRSIDLLRQAQHLVHETGVEVHVGAENLATALGLIDSLDGKALQTGHELILAHPVLLHSELVGHLLEQDGPRVGESIDSMADTIDQPGAVIGLLAEYLAEIVHDLLLILPVLDVVADVADHVADLDVGSSMLRTLQ